MPDGCQAGLAVLWLQRVLRLKFLAACTVRSVVSFTHMQDHDCESECDYDDGHGSVLYPCPLSCGGAPCRLVFAVMLLFDEIRFASTNICFCAPRSLILQVKLYNLSHQYPLQKTPIYFNDYINNAVVCHILMNI